MNFQSFVVGCLLGFLIGHIVLPQTSKHFNAPKLQVGDCVSNGLFIEQVVRIEEADGEYITEGLFASGRKSLPNKTEYWLVEDEPKVDCHTGELLQ